MKTEVVPARILLVDDNPHGLLARQLILREIGYAVDTANSGEEAWEILQKTRYDVVVTDFRMGRMDGLELIQLIRDHQPAMRIVLLSGFAACLGMTEQSTGADEVITKSNKEGPELVRAVRKLVQQGPRRKPLASQTAVSAGAVRKAGC